MTPLASFARGRRLPVRIAVTVEATGWPTKPVLQTLARACIAAALDEAPLPRGSGATEVSIVFSDDEAIRALNAQWRSKDKPTNVLSFPAFSWDGKGAAPPMLGDIVLARATVAREAVEQGKTFEDHLAHLIVHGFLHLLGHDHEDDAEAETMENAERRALARLAIADPYALSPDEA